MSTMESRTSYALLFLEDALWTHHRNLFAERSQRVEYLNAR